MGCANKFYLKLNHKEVAQKLGMTAEAAKSRYHGLKKYFSAMAESDLTEGQDEAIQDSATGKDQATPQADPTAEKAKIKEEELEDDI